MGFREVTKFMVKKRALEEGTFKVDSKESYQSYLKSSHWNRRRKQFWKTHKPVCYCCNEAGYIIHHCSYGRLFKEKNKDLVAVCEGCHSDIHTLVLNKKAKLKEAHTVLKKLINMGISISENFD